MVGTCMCGYICALLGIEDLIIGGGGFWNLPHDIWGYGPV